MTWFAPGEIGQAGLLRVIKDDAKQMILAMYANPLVGTLHRAVPLADRLLPAANDTFYLGNIDG